MHGLFSQVNSLNKILALVIGVVVALFVIRMIPQLRQIAGL